jgi:uncharacterized glyoxalase superfamily protein PhnB
MTTISFMLAVDDAGEASTWYQRALGAIELWSLGSVRALEADGLCFLLHEPTDGFATPAALKATSVRIEVFTDDPDSLVDRAVAAGADGSGDDVREYETPWGPHRQGDFRDPFGHVWLVGDNSPLGWRGSV